MKLSIAQIDEFCIGCGEKVSIYNTTGYCIKCFRSNVNGCRSFYHRKKYKQYKHTTKYWKKNGIIITEEELKHHYQLTHCELCSRNFDNDLKNLDHCHKTGKYRGTICRQCNTSLGKLGDDLDLIIKRLTNYKKIMR